MNMYYCPEIFEPLQKINAGTNMSVLFFVRCTETGQKFDVQQRDELTSVATDITKFKILLLAKFASVFLSHLLFCVMP